MQAVQKANRVKQKLRKLFTSIDSGMSRHDLDLLFFILLAKSGSIADQAFVDILQLNGVTLREGDH